MSAINAKAKDSNREVSIPNLQRKHERKEDELNIHKLDVLVRGMLKFQHLLAPNQVIYPEFSKYV